MHVLVVFFNFQTIPLMLYPQDVGFKTDWSAMRERDDQVACILSISEADGEW